MGEVKKSNIQKPSDKLLVGKGKESPLIKFFTKKRIIVIISMLIIAIIIFIMTSYFINKNKPITNACSTPASSSILQNAKANFANNNVSQLKAVFENIKSLRGYQNDPNCMYIITRYYINTSNLTNAQSSLKQLTSDYRNDVLNPNLMGNVSVTDLQTYITFTLESQQQIQHNAQTLSPNPQLEPKKTK